MKRFYEDKIVPIGQPSQKRWVSRALGPVHTCVCVCSLYVGTSLVNPWGLNGVPVWWRAKHACSGPAWRGVNSGTCGQLCVPTGRHSSWLLRLVPEISGASSRGWRGACKKTACLRKQHHSWSWKRGCFRVWMDLQKAEVTAVCPEKVTDTQDEGPLLL